MEPGIYFDISNEQYHTGAGISKSGLDLIATSPLHYWANYLDPERKPREEKDHFRIGTAIHTAILEPEEFEKRYVVIPEDAPRRPTKSQINAKKPSDETLIAIDWWEKFEADVAENSKTILSQGEVDTCMAIQRNVRRSKIAKQIFSEQGFAEVSLFWKDADTGVLCKCRPDWLLTPYQTPAILDVKSTKSAKPDEFMRSSWSYRYHVAAAWYLDGAAQVLNEKPDSFMFLAVEKEPPYACAWYYANETMIEAGRREYRSCLQIYARALDLGVWDGYPDRLHQLGLPYWAEKQLGMAA